MTRLTVRFDGLTEQDKRRIAHAMSEDELQEACRSLITQLGLKAQHIHDSRRCWLPGWPDLEILGHGIYYRELKSETGRLSPEQRAVGSAITNGGGNWAVWRPRDWVNGTIRRQLEEIAGIAEMF